MDSFLTLWKLEMFFHWETFIHSFIFLINHSALLYLLFHSFIIFDPYNPNRSIFFCCLLLWLIVCVFQPVGKTHTCTDTIQYLKKKVFDKIIVFSMSRGVLILLVLMMMMMIDIIIESYTIFFCLIVVWL